MNTSPSDLWQGYLYLNKYRNSKTTNRQVATNMFGIVKITN